MIFELSKFTDRNYVMHCTTKEEAVIFTTFLHNQGREWVTGSPYLGHDNWKSFGPKTCYRFNVGTRGSIDTYEGCGMKILEFESFDWDATTGYNIDDYAFDDFLDAM